jgi:hypothetical protein
MYRCEQERVCQTLENITTSTERHRCRLDKNGRDREVAFSYQPLAVRYSPLSPRTVRQAHGPEQRRRALESSHP